MSLICIRKITVADSPEVKTLSMQLGYELDEDSVKKNINEVFSSASHYCVGAFSDNRLVGYVHAERYVTLYCKPLVNILGIVVDESARFNGVGKMLMESVEKWAIETGCGGVRLNSGEKRTDAHKFYEAIGYHSYKSHKHFYRYF